MHSSSLKWSLSALLTLSLVAVMCHAQRPNFHVSTPSISGTLLFTRSRQPAIGVKVQVTLVAGNLRTSTLTDQTGKFAFGELAPGDYIVDVEELGCEPIRQRVRVDLNSKPLLLYLDRASSPLSAEVISARELSIPSKARRAFQRGVQRLARNDFSGSLPQFQRAISEFRNYYEAYYSIGIANLELAQRDDAEEAFLKSIELSQGQYAKPQLALGALLCDEQRFAEAEQFLRKGLELDDTSWIGRYALARALFSLNRPDEAERSANDVVVRKADIPEVYLLLANIHIRQRNYSAALENLDHYLELDPDSETSAMARVVQQDARRALSKQEALSAP